MTFQSQYAPSRDSALGQAWGNAINVRVGQIVFARTVADPNTVYVIKIHLQAQNETMVVRYFVLGD